MAIEDFTGYTEVDTGDDITVTASKCTATNLPENMGSYVRKNFGANYFSGDFKHDFTFKWTSASADGVYIGVYAVSDDYQSLVDMDGNNKGLRIIVIADIVGSEYLELKDYATGNGANDGWAGTITQGTTFYMTLMRVGTTATLNVYSDSARTSLVISLHIHDVVDKYSTVYPIVCMNHTGGGNTSTYEFSNLNLNLITGDLHLLLGLGHDGARIPHLDNGIGLQRHPRSRVH